MKNLKVFFRTLWRNKLYTVITVFGFALSLTFVILLGAYIQQEWSVDRFHVNGDRIFRAVSEKRSSFGPRIGPELQGKCPEIECYTRLSENSGYVTNREKEKITFNFLLADSTFFRMFSFPLVEGNADEALKTRHSVVLSRSFARKLFGEQSALGQEILLRDEFRLVVGGIMEDMPDRTHFNKCDGIVNFSFLAEMWHYPQLLENNNNSSFGLYVMAVKGADLPSKAPQILEDFKKDYWLYQREYSKEFHFEPLTEVYFGGKEGQGVHGNSKMLVLILSAIAAVILILALINYNNLSVAQAGFRAKEAAIKKLLGTYNSRLFRQFIGESLALCTMAFLLAIVFSVLLQPLFNQLLDTRVALTEHLDLPTLFTVLISVGILGVVAGIAPAFMMTRFHPVEVVKGAFRKKTKGVYSKVLICFQYTVAIALIICTLVITEQANFMRNYDLGFDKENVVYLSNAISPSQKEALRSEFEKIPGVKGVSYVCGTPIDGGNNNSFTYKERSLSFQAFKVDSVFFRLMGIEVIKTGVAESRQGMWLNEAGVKALELEDLPTEFNPRGNEVVPVMGIVKNFHFRDLTQQVGPAWFSPLGEEEWPWSILVKVSGQNPAQVFTQVRETYSRFIDGVPFDYGFMDQEIDRWYKDSERTAGLIGYFSAIAIILCMMGILAMAIYFIQQRVKEIGVRRVNGATVGNVLQMLITGFMKWIVLAFVIACPIAWYAMTNWLQNFAYRTEISWWIFAVAGGFACLVALLMVGWQSYKAAVADPVDSLRSE